MPKSLRTQVLTLAGRSWPARAWAKSRCKNAGVEFEYAKGVVKLRRGQQAILLGPRYMFFVPKVCGAFDTFSHAIAPQERDGITVTDFALNPDAFSLCLGCMANGVILENRNGEVWLIKGDRAMVLAPQHFIYTGTLAKAFDLYFSPLIPEERDGLKVLDYSKPGRLQTYSKSGLQFEMASFPEEEDAIEDYLRWYRPQEGDVVFDMGAHCGVSSYKFSKLVGPDGKVISFEPDPVNYGILKRNIERHGLSNVVAVQAAISGHAGQLAFNSEGTIGSGLVSVMLRESVGSTVTVEAITLADAFERWGVPALCKIDIEGAEIDVLENSGETLRSHRTNLVLDTNHPQANGEMTASKVEAILQGYGYETLSEANPLLTTWARPTSG